jgi:hypothetical protein
MSWSHAAPARRAGTRAFRKGVRTRVFRAFHTREGKNAKINEEMSRGGVAVLTAGVKA